MQQAQAGEAESIRDQAKTVITERAATLTALIEENPRAALSFAFSPELLADLAAKFPESAGLLETHGTWQGAIEVWVADYPPPTGSRIGLYSKTTVRMNVGGEWLEVHFAGQSSANLQSGATLQAIGVQVGSAIVASSATAQASTTTSSGRDEQ